MFLEMLSDNQKELFLHLAFKAASANGVIEDVEKEMLMSFAKEMEISPILSSDMDLGYIVDAIKENCGKLERQIVLFELVGIMLSDNECDNEEMTFLNSVADKLEITKESLDNMVVLVKEYINLYSKIFDSVIRQ